MRAACQRHRSAGFTLVEVIAALIIFSVGVVALVEGIGTSIRRQSDLLDRQRAAMIAENILEEIAYTQDLETGQNEGAQEGEDARFSWSTNIEDAGQSSKVGDSGQSGQSGQSGLTGLMSVTVVVTWGEGGARGSYSLATLMLQNAESTSDMPADPAMEAGSSRSARSSSGRSSRSGGGRSSTRGGTQ